MKDVSPWNERSTRSVDEKRVVNKRLRLEDGPRRVCLETMIKGEMVQLHQAAPHNARPVLGEGKGLSDAINRERLPL